VSSPELVTVTIDGREIQVPKGQGMVETALDAGIEIPVFCYEPRLGAPVGACRMCLCEVEGMPKLQAACTMTAQDGLVLSTAQTSAKAAEGQNAVLEFILLNHPLDCPDCDKGGECPLQDLTFRWGPGASRMRFPKRTFDKPIPVSPLIALDRERCILCYRCTRFSETVAEDGQLVAINRGAGSIIATFEDEPYRAHFSGNVLELCPVGALTSTTYRFRARPWEIQNVPTVCGLCPVGCNTWATTREGKVARILSRNHAEVDEGWLCDKGRFAYEHLRAEDRIAVPRRRVRRRGFEPVSFEAAVDEAERGLRDAGGPVVVAFSGSETVEQATAIARLVREGLGGGSALIPDTFHPGLDRFRAPISAIREADLCLVFGDEPVVERAPVLDLWLRAARRGGAEVITLNPAGSVALAPRSAAWAAAELQGERPAPELRDARESIDGAERVAIVWSEDDDTGGAHALALAESIGDKASVYLIPRTPNGRGVAAAWGEPGRVPEGEVGILIVSGDEAAESSVVRDIAERAKFVLTTAMFESEGTLWAHLVVPGTSYLERDGTTVNLEGRPQRQRRAVAPAPPAEDELVFFARLAGRFGVEVDPWPSMLPEDQAPLPEAEASDAEVPAPNATAPKDGGKGLAVVRYRSLFSGAAVERVKQLQFQRPLAEIELSYEDASKSGISGGDSVSVSSNGSSKTLRARVNRKLRGGVARIPSEHADGLGDRVSISRMSDEGGHS
jgi:NADH-quinone oxidoreductase subunit G